jgi:aspartate/methionine/tyrosine aminotransferase
MQYRRMPIEIESPEGIGYENILYNLAESSFADQRFGDLGIDLKDLVLQYGDHMGKPALRELLAKDAGLDADDFLLTPGAAAALFIVATSLLDKQSEMVVVQPNYATNIETPLAIGAQVKYLSLRFEDNYQINFGELEKLVTPATRLISITYPHNPTGVIISEDTLLNIIALAKREQCYLLVDETYRAMSFETPLPVAASLGKHVISVSSLSKAYGLPGIRLGWITCADHKLMETFLAAKEQIFITNSVVDEEVAYQFLAKCSQQQTAAKETILANFAIVKQFMQQQPYLEWVEPKGGCVCFPRIKQSINMDTAAFYVRLLQHYKTYVGRGGWFNEDDRHMRIGFGWCAPEKIFPGLQNIIAAIEDLKQK